MKQWLWRMWLRLLGIADGGILSPPKTYLIGEHCSDIVSDCGLFVPVVYGKTRLAPDLLWFGDLQAIELSKIRTFDYPFDQTPFRWNRKTAGRFVKVTCVAFCAELAINHRLRNDNPCLM
jgi:hypothetical protein